MSQFRKRRIQQSGVTTDGRPVMTGSFWALETFGIPLEESMRAYLKRGWVVDLGDFVGRGMRQGWRWATLRGHVEEALQDVYGADAVSKFKERCRETDPQNTHISDIDGSYTVE